MNCFRAVFLTLGILMILTSAHNDAKGRDDMAFAAFLISIPCMFAAVYQHKR